MMMMTGNHPPPSNLRLEDPTGFISHTFSSGNHSPDGAQYERAFLALQRFLPSNAAEDAAAYGDGEDFDVQLDAFSCDDFRMFEFKVRKCAVARSHDWTACPFAHPGEKARRRDPRKYHYSGNACPDFRKGCCRKGDGCEHAHGVFECWLHPARYRTQPCKDGIHCRRRVCFFAHTQEQLRVLPFSSAVPSSEASPGRFGQDPYFSYLYGSSPKSAFYSPPPSPPKTISPPVSPTNLNSVNQLAGSMRGLQINKMKLNLGLTGSSPPAWGLGYGSPPIRPGFLSMPTTPIRGQGQSPRKLAAFDSWTAAAQPCEVEPAVVRVESGRELREKIYAKLGKENSLERAGRGDPNGGFGQDLGWVGDLVN